ncbi:alpha/beta fold hydrolase [Hoeflea sp. TYP-13]|uniref:alpha/beta fold hydrolase n=1 Tax=Hoeflea sp. TYP-13 TaxID=3230023 RepID=UPI0034C6DE9A
MLQTVTLTSAVRRHVPFATIVALVAWFVLAPSQPSSAADMSAPVQSHSVQYRSEMIDGLKIAYREAGNRDRPTVLLLHGFPTSSHMFRNLIPVLAQKYNVLAPDYPGFGASDMPAAEDYDYSFANIASLMTSLIDKKGVDEYAVYLMDYGAPVGYRMFADDPERVSAFIIQNGNAYEEGLREFWDPIKAYWADPSRENGDKLRGFLSLDATKWQFTHGMQNPEAVSPDNFWHVQYLLDRPGNQEVQLELFLDYGTNVPEYVKWQALFRKHQPPALLVWGKNDHIFPAEGAYPYKRDLENLEFHLLDTGHFALEEYGPEIAANMLKFLAGIETAETN